MIDYLRYFLDTLRDSGNQADVYDFWMVIGVTLKALLAGLFLSVIYKRLHDPHSSFYQIARSFFLIILGMSGILIIINKNVMGAFSLIGAISLIRFRSAMKSPLDTAFYFFSILIGASIPSKMYWVIVLCLIFIFLFSLIDPKLPSRKSKLVKFKHELPISDLRKNLFKTFNIKIIDSTSEQEHYLTRAILIAEDIKEVENQFSKVEGINII